MQNISMPYVYCYNQIYWDARGRETEKKTSNTAESRAKSICILFLTLEANSKRTMRQVLGPGALGRPRGIGWRGRWEGGSGWETHVNPWLIHVSVWQNPLQYCKVISLQLIKINEKKKKRTNLKSWTSLPFRSRQQRQKHEGAVITFKLWYYWTVPLICMSVS